jgi:trans-L-3-hydroxyproline dehydratase
MGVESMAFEPPQDWKRITTIDAHTAGEPLRVVTSGWPEIPGDTMLARRQYARRHHDDLRRALMLEPRGHADMYGCILTPPATEDGDVGVLFMHNEGLSTMCGHGIIGLVTVGIECGMLEGIGQPPVSRIDTAAGRVTAKPSQNGNRVESVSFRNVPSFLVEKDLRVEVAGVGTVRYDIAFGGAFYAYVDASDVGIELTPENYARIIDVAMRIKRSVIASHVIKHPDGDPDLNFLYGTILVQPLSGSIHSRNVCVFADGEVDRSPTGTGVSGRAAIHHARGELGIDETITIESLIGTVFDTRVVETTGVGPFPAIIPEVTGSAYITGRHEFFMDPDDPLRNGLLLR